MKAMYAVFENGGFYKVFKDKDKEKAKACAAKIRKDWKKAGRKVSAYVRKVSINAMVD